MSHNINIEKKGLSKIDTVLERNHFFKKNEKRSLLQSLYVLLRFNTRSKKTKKNLKLILNSGFYDYEWYSNNYPEIPHRFKTVKGSLLHYYEYGWKQNKNPGENFNTLEYLKTFSEFKNKEKNPLLYCLKKDSYYLWLKKSESNNIQHILKKLTEFKLNPKLSIVLPVYNPNPLFLRKCIDSVVNQSYKNWQLCIADDCSTDPQIKEILQEYIQIHSNIDVVFRNINGHISEASNSALNLVKGEWTLLLDHDDELAVNALYYVVKTINKNPNTSFIYSDEDKIDENGKRFSPHFKSDFNLDLLYSQNYISHLGVYKSSILKQIKGFRKGVEGSQDYDLLLRYLNYIDHKNIIHIPKILYHWRAIVGSTALSADQKSYTTDAGIKALNNYFEEKKEKVIVEKGKAENIYRVKWPIKNNPLVSIIIPAFNGFLITQKAINSILEKTSYTNYEIILIDNNSNDSAALKYFKELENHPKISVLRYREKFNFSAINNFGVLHAKGELLALLNNDIEIINNDWLTEMVSQAIRPDIGCVGAMLCYPDDTIQHGGVILGIGGVANHSHIHLKRNHPGYYRRLQVVQNYSAVTAACLVVHKEIYEEVEGLNEKDLAVAFNDVDFCLKVREAGYRNLWTPYAELYHHESISRGFEDTPEKKIRFNNEVNYMLNTWKGLLKNDPYYNPNLTLMKEDFSIKTY